MSSEFQQKLHLYKEGKLNKEEIKEIENEIDKFTSIMDYLNEDDKAFLEELKQPIPSVSSEDYKPAKLLKRKVNSRIIALTTVTVFLASIIILFLIILTSNITASLFGLNYKESYVKRQTIVQLAEMFYPQYSSTGSREGKSLFAQHHFDIYLNNKVGNTLIDKAEINVRYSFGRPVKDEAEPRPSMLLSLDFLTLLNGHEAYPMLGFNVLENAPQGTKAKVFIEFNKKFTAQQIKENFIDQINTTDSEPLSFKPIAVIDSKLTIANPSYYRFTPVYPYDGNNAEQMQKRAEKQNQYESMDDQAHKESLIGNLYLIKNNMKLLQAVFYDNFIHDINIDDMIKYVENNGTEYMGVYVSARREELMTLKGNPFIHCMSVENIVVW